MATPVKLLVRTPDDTPPFVVRLAELPASIESLLVQVCERGNVDPRDFDIQLVGKDGEAPLTNVAMLKGGACHQLQLSERPRGASVPAADGEDTAGRTTGVAVTMTNFTGNDRSHVLASIRRPRASTGVSPSASKAVESSPRSRRDKSGEALIPNALMKDAVEVADTIAGRKLNGGLDELVQVIMSDECGLDVGMALVETNNGVVLAALREVLTSRVASVWPPMVGYMLHGDSKSVRTMVWEASSGIVAGFAPAGTEEKHRIVRLLVEECRSHQLAKLLDGVALVANDLFATSAGVDSLLTVLKRGSKGAIDRVVQTAVGRLTDIATDAEACRLVRAVFDSAVHSKLLTEFGDGLVACADSLAADANGAYSLGGVLKFGNARVAQNLLKKLEPVLSTVAASKPGQELLLDLERSLDSRDAASLRDALRSSQSTWGGGGSLGRMLRRSK